MPDSFWDFPPCSKYDRLYDGQHDHLYHGALRDQETGIQKLDRHTYIIYGKEEALYMKPVGFIYRLGLELLGAFLSLNE